MSFDSIRNYYEHAVYQHIIATLGNQSPEPDSEYLADVACIALNQLPPRYIRHEVDMAFYVSSQERTEIASKISAAVSFAVKFIAERQKNASPP